jgi:hypothetical protein
MSTITTITDVNTQCRFTPNWLELLGAAGLSGETLVPVKGRLSIRTVQCDGGTFYELHTTLKCKKPVTERELTRILTAIRDAEELQEVEWAKAQYKRDALPATAASCSCR